METEHSETVVEKAIAYVKDMFGVQPVDKASDGEANRVGANDSARGRPDARRRPA
jgi:hypothetical protein